MADKAKKEHIVGYKLLYTACILLIYLAGRSIPLSGVDISAYRQKTFGAEELLMQVVGGDAGRYSLFALGISPFMISSIVMQMVTAYRRSVSKVRVSMVKTNRTTAMMTLGLAVVQAVAHVDTLEFRAVGNRLWMAQLTAVAGMVTGVMVIMWLSGRNKKYGIGGQTALILVNIIDGMCRTLATQELKELIVPILIALVLLPVMVFLENTEKRIPVQRIAIRNIYADKNYLAIKLNPIGVMPVMFSSAFFALPQLLVSGLGYLYPDNLTIRWWMKNMTLTRPLGIVCYVGILYILTIVFSMIMLSPGELAEQFLKNGDSIVNLHPGRDTKYYLRGTIIRMSLVSATIMGVCVSVPLVLQLTGIISGGMIMFPTTVMMLAGLWCNLFREFQAVKSFDTYQSFL